MYVCIISVYSDGTLAQIKGIIIIRASERIRMYVCVYMRVYVYVACSMSILHGLVSHAPSHHKRLRLRDLGFRV
jgi:hypothetical protein